MSNREAAGPPLATFRAGLEQLGLPLEPTAGERFQQYYDLLRSGAARLALTTVTDYEDVQRRHFLEAAALGALLRDRGLLAGGVRLLDLGSGAGIPGLPLKILFPAVRVTLLEATRKKAAWLRQVVAGLGLGDTLVLDERAEDLGRRPEHRGRYDLVTARAVAPLPALLELAVPLLRVGGTLAALKGGRAPQEAAAAAAAAAALNAAVEVAPAAVPFSVHEQWVVLARKTAETVARFPRRAGIPAKRPL